MTERWQMLGKLSSSTSQSLRVDFALWSDRLLHPAGQKQHLCEELQLLSVCQRCGKPHQADQHDRGGQQDLRQPQWGVLQVSLTLKEEDGETAIYQRISFHLMLCILLCCSRDWFLIVKLHPAGTMCYIYQKESSIPETSDGLWRAVCSWPGSSFTPL